MYLPIFFAVSLVLALAVYFWTRRIRRRVAAADLVTRAECQSLVDVVPEGSSLLVEPAADAAAVDALGVYPATRGAVLAAVLPAGAVPVSPSGNSHPVEVSSPPAVSSFVPAAAPALATGELVALFSFGGLAALGSLLMRPGGLGGWAAFGVDMYAMLLPAGIVFMVFGVLDSWKGRLSLHLEDGYKELVKPPEVVAGVVPDAAGDASVEASAASGDDAEVSPAVEPVATAATVAPVSRDLLPLLRETAAGGPTTGLGRRRVERWIAIVVSGALVAVYGGLFLHKWDLLSGVMGGVMGVFT